MAHRRYGDYDDEDEENSKKVNNSLFCGYGLGEQQDDVSNESRVYGPITTL